MGLLTLRQESWAEVVARVHAATGPIAWGWLAAREAAGQDWQLVVLSVLGHSSVDPVALEYQECLLVRESVTPAVAARRLRKWHLMEPTVRGRVRAATEIARVAPYWYTTEPEQYLHRSAVSAEWPRYEVSVSLNQQHAPPTWNPVVQVGVPVYPTLAAAVADIVYSAPPERLSGGIQSELRIVLPDPRGRIESVAYREGIVRVDIARGVPRGLAGCTLRSIWRRAQSATWERQDVRLTRAGHVELTVNDLPHEMWNVLVDPAGRPLDRRGWDARTRAQTDTPQSREMQVRRWLTEGEHDALEFKQALGGESTKRRFADAVAAFANGAGGVILLGVADDATITGYGPPKAEEQIVSIVRDSVQEPVELGFSRTEVDGKTIIVVEVPEGDVHLKPYRSGDRVIIRANATDRVASTWEIRQLAAQADENARRRPSRNF
jgi:hypothetical protein